MLRWLVALTVLTMLLLSGMLGLMMEMTDRIEELSPQGAQPMQQEYVKITDTAAGTIQVLDIQPGWTAAKLVDAVQGGLVLVCYDCWMSGALKIEIYTVQAPGETPAGKQERHEQRVAALQTVYPMTGECQ